MLLTASWKVYKSWRDPQRICFAGTSVRLALPAAVGSAPLGLVSQYPQRDSTDPEVEKLRGSEFYGEGKCQGRTFIQTESLLYVGD